MDLLLPMKPLVAQKGCGGCVRSDRPYLTRGSRLRLASTLTQSETCGSTVSWMSLDRFILLLIAALVVIVIMWILDHNGRSL